MNFKWYERKLWCSSLRYYPGIRLDGLRKTTKHLSRDRRSPDRDLILGPPGYEVGVLRTLSLCSVHVHVKSMLVQRICTGHTLRGCIDCILGVVITCRKAVGFVPSFLYSLIPINDCKLVTVVVRSEAWVRIPLSAWMFVRVFLCCVVLCR
jgi:hypothetical protein